MNWIETPESSNLERFGYDSSSMVLRVEFKSGGTYDYYDVPESLFEQMQAASSRGSYLAKNIKGSYRYARV